LLSNRADFAYGHPKNPISMDHLIAKFQECCKHSVKPLSPDSIEQVVYLVTHIEEVKDISEIVRLLS